MTALSRRVPHPHLGWIVFDGRKHNLLFVFVLLSFSFVKPTRPYDSSLGPGPDCSRSGISSSSSSISSSNSSSGRSSGSVAGVGVGVG